MKKYHGIELRYPGYICGDEKVEYQYANFRWGRESCERQVRQLLRKLASQEVVEAFSFSGHEWYLVLPEYILAVDHKPLCKLRIKLTADGEVPRVNTSPATCTQNGETLTPVEALIADVDNFNALPVPLDLNRLVELKSKAKLLARIVEVLLPRCDLEDERITAHTMAEINRIVEGEKPVPKCSHGVGMDKGCYECDKEIGRFKTYGSPRGA